MPVVIVVGASGDILPVTVHGAAAASFAQLYAATLNDIAFGGGLVAADLTPGQSPPPVPAGAVGEGVILTPGTFNVPAGYSFVTIAADKPVTLNEATAVAPTSVLAGLGGTTLYGGPAGGFFIAGGGNNLFSGGQGNYVVATGAGNDSIYGGLGSDLIEDGAGHNQVNTGAGNDAVFSQGTDLITLGSGNSDVTLAGSNSTVSSSTGASTITDKGIGTQFLGGPAATIVFAGQDGTYSFSGNATVSGGENDTIAAAGNTTVFGGVNTTVFQNGNGSLSFIATTGHDATVGGGGAAASVRGADGSDITFLGSAGTNTLAAMAGSETLDGGLSTGVLDLIGGRGNASLIGGSGADTLAVGSGSNTLTGGAGANVFSFTSGSGSQTTITDFGTASGNLVALVGYGANADQAALATAVDTGNGGSVITLGRSTTITFLDLTADQLKAHSGQFTSH